MTSGSCTTPLRSRIPLPHIPSGILLASRLSTCMVQPWAELDLAGVGLSFAIWMAVVIAPYIVFVLMLDLLHSVLRSRVACLWIGPRLALAARCGSIYSLSLTDISRPAYVHRYSPPILRTYTTQVGILSTHTFTNLCNAMLCCFQIMVTF